MWTLLWCFQLIFVMVLTERTLESVMDMRYKMLYDEMNMMVGNDIVLNDNEQRANDLIMYFKEMELDRSFQSPATFNLSKHFFEYKDAVKETELYQIIQMMPKGAILHAHDTGLVNPDYIVLLTYLDDLFVCFENDEVKFLFSKETPTSSCLTHWQLLKNLRYSSNNIEKFDKMLKQHFTIVTDDPRKTYTDINKVWGKFQRYFITAGPLLTYKPVWEKYFYETLRTFRNDNVMYVEIRSILPDLYDLEGNVYGPVATAETYKQVLDTFMVDYPDFFGAKLIYAPLRCVSEQTVKNYLKTAKELKDKLPDFFAGFDLVGQEDLGNPTKDFLPALLEAGEDIDYFFHAGETNWYGTNSDENLIDAVVLGVKRIGHAYALLKHPRVLKEIKDNDIALEVNVISNLVLGLVEDMRNHPLASFLAQGLPVVISSDDPGVWEADPLSHDFYVTFVGVASKHADLRLLKKLALNSLFYSTAPNKDRMVHEFEIRWTKFINNVINSYVQRN